MSDYILRFIRSFTKLFFKDKEPKPSQQLKTPPRFCTPMRPSSQMSHRQLRPPRHSSTPASRRAPISFPILQCPSQISLKRFNSESDVAPKDGTFLRSRSSGMTRNKVYKPFGLPFLTKIDNSRIGNKNEPEFPPLPSCKSSETSFDFYSVAGDVLDPATDSSIECQDNIENMFPIKQQINKKNILPCHPGCPHKCNSASSKIPVRNQCRYSIHPNLEFVRRQRGLHTMTTQPSLNVNEIKHCQVNEDTGESDTFMCSDICSWATYRLDTITRFERVFKALSKKKHAIGNLIDSTSHARWMQLSGIAVDRHAKIFKLFAGGKVVLNIGEYKFLIKKICSIYDLEYWDVLRKMATFQDEDLQQAAVSTSL